MTPFRRNRACRPVRNRACKGTYIVHHVSTAPGGVGTSASRHRQMTPRTGEEIRMTRALLLSAASLFTLCAASPAFAGEQPAAPEPSARGALDAAAREM